MANLRNLTAKLVNACQKAGVKIDGELKVYHVTRGFTAQREGPSYTYDFTIDAPAKKRWKGCDVHGIVFSAKIASVDDSAKREANESLARSIDEAIQAVAEGFDDCDPETCEVGCWTEDEKREKDFLRWAGSSSPAWDTPGGENEE